MLEISFVDVEFIQSLPKKKRSKICPTCDIQRYMFEFYVDRSRRDQRSVLCMDCQRFKDGGGDFESDAFSDLVDLWNDRVKEWQAEYRRVVLNYQVRLRKKISEQESLFYVARNLAQSVVMTSLRRRGFLCRTAMVDILGCSYEEFRWHIESQFVDGMGWHNRSAWHIDHIIPISSGNTEEDVRRLTHYTNLRPIWALDNLRKHKKIES